MLVYIQRSKLLCVNQSGFRPFHSCTSALLKVTDDLRAALDRDQINFLTLLDFSKAFDTVNHQQLLLKLRLLALRRLLQSSLKHTLVEGNKQLLLTTQCRTSLQPQWVYPKGQF